MSYRHITLIGFFFLDTFTCDVRSIQYFIYRMCYDTILILKLNISPRAYSNVLVGYKVYAKDEGLDIWTATGKGRWIGWGHKSSNWLPTDPQQFFLQAKIEALSLNEASYLTNFSILTGHGSELFKPINKTDAKLLQGILYCMSKGYEEWQYFYFPVTLGGHQQWKVSSVCIRFGHIWLEVHVLICM